MRGLPVVNMRNDAIAYSISFPAKTSIAFAELATLRPRAGAEYVSHHERLSRWESPWFDALTTSESSRRELVVRQAHHERDRLTTSGTGSPRAGQAHHERDRLTTSGTGS